jgi:phage shock protein C
MWAGVCGGIAEYFDLDPSLVRLLWIAATIVSGGLTVPLYILAWIILPRDNRPPMPGPYHWRDWSQEFHNETQRLAEEARRMAGDVRGVTHSWHEHPPAEQPTEAPSAPASNKSAPTPTGPAPVDEWWTSSHYVEPPRPHHNHPRSTGAILVGLGVLLLAANAGIFNWLEWRMMWPLIFIGLGLVLLARQTDWGR